MINGDSGDDDTGETCMQERLIELTDDPSSLSNDEDRWSNADGFRYFGNGKILRPGENIKRFRGNSFDICPLVRTDDDFTMTDGEGKLQWTKL